MVYRSREDLEHSKLNLDTGESLVFNFLSKAQEIEIEMWNQTVSSAQPSTISDLVSSGKYTMQGQEYYPLHASTPRSISPNHVLHAPRKIDPCHDVANQDHFHQVLYNSKDAGRLLERGNSFTTCAVSGQGTIQHMPRKDMPHRREASVQHPDHGHAAVEDNTVDNHDANSWYGTNWTGSTTPYNPWPGCVSPSSGPYQDDFDGTLPSLTDEVWEPTTLAEHDLIDEHSESPLQLPSETADIVHIDASSIIYSAAWPHNQMPPELSSKQGTHFKNHPEGLNVLSLRSGHSNIVARRLGSECSSPKNAADGCAEDGDIRTKGGHLMSPRQSDGIAQRTASPMSSSVGSSKRTSSKVDSSNVRQGPLYQIAPREDGLYHCYFEGDESCRHEPTKLKCNYDKYVDSHIRPHACHVSGCEDLKFSSAACKLRHEREAHGSHGHGVKPYVCLYRDCERSKVGRGFPRSWNRNDHMKRMHGHDNTVATIVKRAAPQTLLANSSVPCPSKKRSNSDQGQATPEKRSKAGNWESVPETSLAEPKEQSLQDHLCELDRQWRQQHSRLRALVAELQGPQDQQNIRQLHNDVSNLGNISGKIAQIQSRLNSPKPAGQT